MIGTPPMFRNLFQRKSAMNKTPDILKQILQRKAEEIEVKSAGHSLQFLLPYVGEFVSKYRVFYS